MKFKQLLASIQTAHNHFQETAAKAINRSLTIRNWIIGCYIFQLCRQFYLCYPQIFEIAKNELAKTNIQIDQSVTDQFQIFDIQLHKTNLNTNKSNYAFSTSLQLRPEKLVSNLSFSHIVALLILDNPLKRVFYEHECIKGNWGVRELKRQINSLYFERMGLSQDPEKLSRLIQQTTQPTTNPSDFIKNEYTFEFLGISDRLAVSETALQQQLLDHLQEFLLEMGHGFCLEGRQKRFLSEGNTSS